MTEKASSPSCQAADLCFIGCGFHACNDERKGFRLITLNKNGSDGYGTYTVHTGELLQKSGKATRLHTKR